MKPITKSEKSAHLSSDTAEQYFERMSNGDANVGCVNQEAHVSSSSPVSDDELTLLRNSIRALPRQPVKDLLSNDVCARCILRLFSYHEESCSCPHVETRFLGAILNESLECEVDDATVRETKDQVDSVPVEGDEAKEVNVCRVCLGTLQFMYKNGETGAFVQKGCADQFADTVSDDVKREGHEIDGFSIEVSLPQIVVENDEVVRLYLKEKYSSVCIPSDIITVKDLLKLSVTNPLEKLLGVKSNSSSFRIRLTYTVSDASSKDEHLKEEYGSFKRRKTVDPNDSNKLVDLRKVEGHVLTRDSSVNDDGTSFLMFPLDKVSHCGSLTLQCYRTSIYIGGRYLKYSRNVSQTRWIIDDERMGEASIEELIGGNILPMCRGDSYKFHAAGREDIDVRMLGSGRPFLVEIQNARQLPHDAVIKDMEKKINSLESKLVKVKYLKVVDNKAWELMREGEAEKQKQYAALVWISRPLDDDDVQKLSSLKDMKILQKTPIRVLHRRSPLEREKTIHWMRIERVCDHSQYFLLHLCTQAGTYIKEFVHGDLGRTNPSVGSILQCRAEILQLDVTDVKMDCFQA